MKIGHRVYSVLFLVLISASLAHAQATSAVQASAAAALLVPLSISAFIPAPNRVGSRKYRERCGWDVSARRGLAPSPSRRRLTLAVDYPGTGRESAR